MIRKFYLLLAIAIVAFVSDVAAQKMEQEVVTILESVDIFDFDSVDATPGESNRRTSNFVYDYPVKNGVYNGYLYTTNPLKPEPLKIEYGSNFLFSMSRKGYNRFYAGYSLPHIMWKAPVESNATDYPFSHGVHVGYLHASSISKRIPLFLEYGANFQYLFGRASRQFDSGGGYSHFWMTHWGSMYSLNVPLNLALRLGYHGGEKNITPYFGINLRYNIGGAIKQRMRMTTHPSAGVEEIDKIDLFNKDSKDRYAMGEKAFERFQVGVNFGVGYTWRKFYVGVGCIVDANRIINAVKEGRYNWEEHYHIVGRLCQVNISVGVQF